ncbi:hypothetical protein M0R45_030223 [Rubus argutus]|uniref:Uncharacterized protein n=1 Tax=Rubus argutus TaxID=59490 RepID=A0AAW1WCK4_RUBAR
MDQKLADATHVVDGATPVLTTNITIDSEAGQFLRQNRELMLVRIISNNVSPIGGTFEVKVEIIYGTVVTKSAKLVASITKASYFDIWNGIQEKKRVLAVHGMLDFTG